MLALFFIVAALGTTQAEDLASCEEATAAQEALLLNSSHADTYLSRGNAYARKGNPWRAIIDYDLALELDPNNPAVYTNRGPPTTNMETSNSPPPQRRAADAQARGTLPKFYAGGLGCGFDPRP